MDQWTENGYILTGPHSAWEWVHSCVSSALCWLRFSTFQATLLQPSHVITSKSRINYSITKDHNVHFCIIIVEVRRYIIWKISNSLSLSPSWIYFRNTNLSVTSEHFYFYQLVYLFWRTSMASVIRKWIYLMRFLAFHSLLAAGWKLSRFCIQYMHSISFSMKLFFFLVHRVNRMKLEQEKMWQIKPMLARETWQPDVMWLY